MDMKRLRTSLILVVAIAAMSARSLRADQPHMKDALAHLREARAALKQAVHNKGGHRQHALELVDKAIAEVQAGMTYAR
jgi:hypothetical protein